MLFIKLTAPQGKEAYIDIESIVAFSEASSSQYTILYMSPDLEETARLQVQETPDQVMAKIREVLEGYSPPEEKIVKAVDRFTLVAESLMKEMNNE